MCLKIPGPGSRFARPGHESGALDRLHPHPQSVARLRDRPHLPVRLVAGLQRYLDVLQEVSREAFGLHVGEVQAEAHMRAAAERHPGEAVTVALRLLGEAKRVEAVRL